MKNFKKLFAVIIAVMVVMSSMSTVLLGSLVSADTVTADLIISTVGELNDFADAVNNGDNFAGKTVTLSDDIDMDCTGVTIGTKEKPFKGTFDGMGHTIDNLYIYYENDNEAFSQSYVGLFGFTDSAVIKNVTVNNPYIVGKSYVGGIVGCAYTGTIENCHVTGEIDIEGYYMVGGITGQGYAKIIDCSVIGAADWDYSYIGATYFQSDLEGDNVGGIIGFSAEGNGQNIVKISGCEVANVTVSGTRKVGGVAGSAYQNNSIVGCDVSSVTVTTTSTADYASSNASSMAIGGIVGLYLANNDVIGNITDCTVEDIILIDENNVGVNMGYVTGGLRVNGVYSAPAVVATNIVVSGENTGATVDYLVTAELPSATVTDLTVAELLATGAPELTFAKKFVADTAADDTLAGYSDWYADFVLTVNKDVTFNADGSGDGYLAGHYGDYGWVSVPFDDVTLKAGTSLKIMEYAAELMNKAGLKFTYKEVYELVKEFKCGVFFDEEFLAANQDLEVTLELNIYNPEDETVSHTITPEETFDPSKAIVYPDAPSATVTDIDIKELAENDAPELTFAKKFVADEADEDTVATYSDWYADFVLTINETVTFNANGTADGYLAGHYGDYGWVSVPFEDVTLEANTPLNIMEYAAKLMGQDALNITYNDVLNFVKEFSCGVFFSEEFLAENPDVKVDLGLNVFSPVDKEIEYTVHEKEPFVLSDAIVYSDVNIDGDVDAADITLVRKALIGTAVAESWYDVNVDDSFDVRDLVRVKKDAAEAVISAAEALAEALAAGGEVVLTKDIELPEGFALVVPKGVTTTLNLNGHTLNAGYQEGSTTNHTYAITNRGTLTITGEGSINTRGIYNYGNMTLESGTINAIDGNGGYGVRNHPGATLTMNGGTIATTLEDDNRVSEGGYDATPVRVDEGANFVMNRGELKNICDFTCALDNYGTSVINDGKISSGHTAVANHKDLTVNGGEIICNGVKGASQHALWAAAGTTTINGGTFDGKDSYNGFNVDANAGAVVNIYGGNFLHSHSGSFYGDGTINVYGGTYADDPSARVADGYIVVKNDDNTFTVTEGATEVADADSLATALGNGNNVVLTDNITVSEISVMNGGSLDGNKNTIYASDISSDDCAITTTGGKVSNLTVVGDAYSTRAIGSGSSGDTVLTEDLILDNIHTDNVLYGINGSGVEGTSVYVTNSTVYGWNSFSYIDLFSFENCTLGKGNCSDGYFVVYGDTTFTDCTFEGVFDMGARSDKEGIVYAAGKTVTINNCNYDGAKVTAENFVKYFYYGPGDEEDFRNLMREVTIIVDGVTVDNSAYL